MDAIGALVMLPVVIGVAHWLTKVLIRDETKLEGNKFYGGGWWR